MSAAIMKRSERENSNKNVYFWQICRKNFFGAHIWIVWSLDAKWQYLDCPDVIWTPGHASIYETLCGEYVCNEK